MTERKVLNKYFPPDFDPAKIPRLKGMKKEKVFSIRTMAPFNMMCLTCRGYIFKAKKFNSRMEECEYTYLDLKEYRFHIRCPTCCSEIIYRTDRENNDYVVESGAKRSFEAYTTAIRQAIKESAQEKEELEKNPIKALEKRTEESMNEFKMSNKIQDLMEQSKNDAPREEMIDDAIALLRQKAELDEMRQDREGKELLDQQLLNQKRVQQEKLQRERSLEVSVIDFSEFGSSKNQLVIDKMNMLKRAHLKRKRECGESSSIDIEPKLQKIEENEQAVFVKSENEVEKKESEKKFDSNLLGLDYDSDSD